MSIRRAYQVITDEDAVYYDKLVAETKPKSGCRHCNGEGNLGVNVKTKEKVVCPCIKNKIKRAMEEYRRNKSKEDKFEYAPKEGADVTVISTVPEEKSKIIIPGKEDEG